MRKAEKTLVNLTGKNAGQKTGLRFDIAAWGKDPDKCFKELYRMVCKKDADDDFRKKTRGINISTAELTKWIKGEYFHDKK
jgi:hypothetical protein